MIADTLDVIGSHMAVLADTISLDLTYFSNKFIESGFITLTAASGVLSKLGISDGDKASQLLYRVRENYKIALKKLVWAEKFIAIFSSQAAYTDLATMLRREISQLGIVANDSFDCNVQKKVSVKLDYGDVSLSACVSVFVPVDPVV